MKVKKLSIVLVIGMILCGTVAKAADWYDQAWRYRQQVTVAANSSGSLTNFTLLVAYTNEASDLWSEAQSGGWDIRFTGGDGTTLMNSEIEMFDGGTSQLWAWVSIPLLSASQSTNLYMYYGNSTVSYLEPQDVWDDDYLGVWHLSESERNELPLKGDVADSSGNDNDGDASTVTPETNMDFGGKVAGAISADGVDDYYDMGDCCDTGTNDFTISFWASFPNLTEAFDKPFISKYLWEDPNNRWFIRLRSGNYIQFQGKTSGSNYLVGNSESTVALSNTWYHIAIVCRWGVSGTTYIHGANPKNALEVAAITASNNAPLRFGWGGNLYGNVQLDEIRISRVARTPEWIATCYSNQMAPQAFSTFAAAETAPGRDPNAFAWGESFNRWNYRQRLVLDHSRVYDSQDFPMLLTEVDFLTNVWANVQVSGGDIAFTAADGETPLSHEIELFDPLAEKAALWLKIPVISEVSNTVVYMYYGNTSVASQQDADNVWDNNFRAVYHMSETNDIAGDDVLDSTANNIDGEANMTPIDGMNVDGMIAGGIDFDGTDDNINMGDVLDLGAGDYTISFWGKWPQGIDNLRVMGKYESVDDSWYIRKEVASARDFMYMRGEENGVEFSNLFDTSGTDMDDGWYYITVTADRSTGRNRLYMSATLSKTNVIVAADSTVAADFTLGGYDGIYGQSSLDEIRISNTVRSEGWINMSYYSQAQPGTFFIDLATQERIKKGTLIVIQ